MDVFDYWGPDGSPYKVCLQRELPKDDKYSGKCISTKYGESEEYRKQKKSMNYDTEEYSGKYASYNENWSNWIIDEYDLELSPNYDEENALNRDLNIYRVHFEAMPVREILTLKKGEF